MKQPRFNGDDETNPLNTKGLPHMEQLRFKSYDTARQLLLDRGFLHINDSGIQEHWTNGRVRMLLERRFGKEATLYTAEFRFCEPAKTQAFCEEHNCTSL